MSIPAKNRRTKRGVDGSRGVKEYYFGELQQDRKMNVGEDESTTTPDAEKELLARTDEDKRSVRNGQETEVSQKSFHIVGSF